MVQARLAVNCGAAAEEAACDGLTVSSVRERCHRAWAYELAPQVSVAETIAGYDELAYEYDYGTHETTRGLEEASLRGFASALPLIELWSRSTVLELGCGTGLLTNELISQTNADQIVASDPSARMLDVAARKLPPSNRNGKSIILTRATAREALLMDPCNDLIVASLADPFLDAAIPSAVATRLKPGGYTFFSVPSRAWGAEERGDRLNIHKGTTRFRTLTGQECRARSHTYDSHELSALFESTGLEILAGGLAHGHQIRRRPVPETAWVLARKSALKDRKIDREAAHGREKLHERLD